MHIKTFMWNATLDYPILYSKLFNFIFFRLIILIFFSKKLLKNDDKMSESEYKFFLDFNDPLLTKDFLATHTDLHKICMNPKSQNLGFFISKNHQIFFFS